jgi:hypothetical protein
MDGEGGKKMGDLYSQRSRHEAPTPLPPLPPFEQLSAWERWREGMALEAHKANATLAAGRRRLRFAVAEPRAAARRAKELVLAAKRLQDPIGPAPLSPLLRRQGTAMRFDVIDVDLDALKAAAKAAGGTFNDAFLAATSLGLRRWHRDHGVEVPELRTAMVVNRRDKDSERWEGNDALAAVMLMPCDDDDPARLIKRCGEIAHQARDDEDALWLMDRTRAAGNRAPLAVSTLLSKRSLQGIEVSLSNVNGIAWQDYEARSKHLDTAAFVVGTMSAVAMILISRAGKARIGLTTCPVAITDPDHLVARFNEAFADLYALAP